MAYVTISAACAGSCYEGFLHKRPQKSNKLFRLPYRCPNGTLGSILLEKRLPQLLSDKPLGSRAWALQESLLSRRLLIYHSHQLEWHCMECKESDGGYVERRTMSSSQNLLDDNFLLSARYGDGIYDHMDHLWAKLLLKSRLYSILERKEITQANLRMWTDIVRVYSSRRLSISSDRLPTIAAVAQGLSRTSLGKYLAGL